MTTSRAALAGPFQGTTLPLHMPSPLDKPDRLARWDAGPRMQVCELELMSGMQFDVSQSKESVSIGFVNLDRKPLKSISIARLVRPSAKVFRQQMDLVASYAQLREERGAEILAQMVPQVPFWSSVIGVQAHRHKYTLELAALALSFTSHVEMRFKHAFACLRPVELSPQIQPMIPTPGHSAWPSGHATEAFVNATVLQALLEAANGTGSRYEEQLQRQAARIAVNRTVAGLHFPADSAVGRLLGMALGEFFVARCTGNSRLAHRGFDGTKFHGPKGRPADFDLRVSMTDNKSGYYQLLPGTSAVAASPLLAFMWDKAVKEWQ